MRLGTGFEAVDGFQRGPACAKRALGLMAQAVRVQVTEMW